MGAEEEMLITLSGGAPWGFRLQGGSEQKRPLQVSKIRKRSKACRGGLWENDVLVSINGKSCAGLSHATAMQIIDSSNGTLDIRVKRIVGGDQTGPRLQRSPSPGRVLSPPSPVSPQAQLLSPELAGAPASAQPSQPRRSQRHLENLTSPPDSEAYYGETDSDADNVGQEKHRRARKKSPRSPPDSTNSKGDAPQDEVSLSEQSGYESMPEAAVQEGAEVASSGGVAKREIVCLPGSRTDTPFSESEGQLRPPSTEGREPSPEAMLLPHATKAIRAERHLIPMVGPVEHPVDEDLTTSYMEKAKQAKLHRHESIQEKNVKEAKTKCRTIASLLTDAPNPHSKGVLMFKKRRQRAKKYTLVSFGSVDEDRSYEEEDGVFPTSESEFDEEGFSDARSLTNHSDWDNTYLEIEKSKSDSEQKEEKQKGLSEASGKGARLFEQQRERAGKYTVEKVPAQKSPQLASAAEPQQDTVNRDMPVPQKADSVPLTIHLEDVQVPGKQPATLPTQLLAPPSPTLIPAPVSTPDPFSTSSTSMFNRSARPFTPGFSGQRPATSSVIFRPSAPKKPSESLSGQSSVVPPFSPLAPGTPANAPVPTHRGPVSSSTSLYIPAPGKPTPPLESQPKGGGSSAETKPSANTSRTSTTSIFLSTPSKPGGEVASTASQPQVPGTASSSLYISPAPSQHVISSSTVPKQPSPAISPAMPRPPSEPLTSREQRIAVPAPRTGILQEARRRGNKKPMFSKIEEKKKNSPNPELLSLVQNLDEKSKGDHPGAGFESGPEEDFLSLGAEACNFMQSSGRKFKTPPPVAPKPQQQDAGLVNGAQDMPQLKGKGAELFAKRQSRMDKFVVEATLKPESKPRTPSPSPSLPSSWKYSPNIRAPPPIAYNPMHSPFYPLAASKSQARKAESKVKKAPGQKSGIKVIDIMSHQPYQLKSAMFCFGDPSSPSIQESRSQPAPQASSSFMAAKHVPVKTAKTQEVRRFSTPVPMPTSSSLAPTVLMPRSATTLDEPVWRTEMASSAPTTPAPFQVELSQSPKLYQSSPEPGQTAQGPSPKPASASRFQVARPKFSAARTGMQANVWRPSFGHH
ncbi:PREDICTED: synaptopodin 2-like protein [Buceros rhinoceros silvestris]|uniref:synaptopodin 2-like protein n=1 Tax=Buceros rhinoceros silvestris TaxID=175836 RepID=UPI0005295A4C|nr:PREDICTED: synaptopodin 2-like protein [Buceros rhinoceros silvestris]